MRNSMLAAAAVAVFASSAVAAEVDQIIARASAALRPSQTMRANFEVVIANGKGESVTWSGTYYQRGGADARTHLTLDHPLDLRGTTVSLRRGPDKQSCTRIYLPAIQRTREIHGDMRGESFLGTDFNYEDLGLATLEFERQMLVGEAVVEGRTCDRIESVPSNGWWYGKIVYYIDRATHLPVRSELYDRQGVLWKIRTFDAIETIDSHPTPIEITMRTEPTGTSTRIRLSNVAYGVDVPAAAFAVCTP